MSGSFFGDWRNPTREDMRTLVLLVAVVLVHGGAAQSANSKWVLPMVNSDNVLASYNENSMLFALTTATYSASVC